MLIYFLLHTYLKGDAHRMTNACSNMEDKRLEIRDKFERKFHTEGPTNKSIRKF